MSDKSIVDLVKKHKDQGNPELPGGTTPEAAARVARKADVMSENIPVDTQMEETLERLLRHVKSKMAWIEIELPSVGLLYHEGVSVIKIRPFTFDDERILKTMDAMGTDADKVVTSLLNNCIEGISAESLTPIDKLYVMFRLRGISYGDNYEITHDCTKCAKTSQLTLKISTLTVTPLDPTYTRFTLPDSEQEVEIKLPKGTDENLYLTADNLMRNLHMFVRTVGGISDPTIVEEFVHRTTVRDIDILRSKIFLPDYGMENHFFYSCKECSTKNRVEIGLNESFFTAS